VYVAAREKEWTLSHLTRKALEAYVKKNGKVRNEKR
jgi:hypothetical protein